MYIISSLTGAVCVILGYWLGKGCPLPRKPTNNIIQQPIETEETKQQQELAKQWDNILNYSGDVTRREV